MPWAKVRSRVKPIEAFSEVEIILRQKQVLLLDENY
jgi:hypothetical protein